MVAVVGLAGAPGTHQQVGVQNACAFFERAAGERKLLQRAQGHLEQTQLPFGLGLIEGGVIGERLAGARGSEPVARVAPAPLLAVGLTQREGGLRAQLALFEFFDEALQPPVVFRRRILTQRTRRAGESLARAVLVHGGGNCRRETRQHHQQTDTHLETHKGILPTGGGTSARAKCAAGWEKDSRPGHRDHFPPAR